MEEAFARRRLSPARAARVRGSLGQGRSAGAEIHQDDALEFLANGQREPFDIVFLDPPFAAAMLDELCRLLDEHSMVRPGSLVYIEEDRATSAVELPPGWGLIKSRTAGNVRYSLARVGDDA